MYGSYRRHFADVPRSQSSNSRKSERLVRLIRKAIADGQAITITKSSKSVRIAYCRLSTDGEYAVFYHGNEYGNVQYKDDGPVVDSIYPDTLGYEEVFKQVKQYE